VSFLQWSSLVCTSQSIELEVPSIQPVPLGSGELATHGLKPHKTFLEWNSDGEISAAAKKPYGIIDHLELLLAPRLRTPDQSSRVLVSALVTPSFAPSLQSRGNRLLAADLTPHNFTTWGFAGCLWSPENPGPGGRGRLLTTRSTHGNREFKKYPAFSETRRSSSVHPRRSTRSSVAQSSSSPLICPKEERGNEGRCSRHRRRPPEQVDANTKFFTTIARVSSPSGRANSWPMSARRVATQVVSDDLVAWLLQLTENPFSSVGRYHGQETGG